MKTILNIKTYAVLLALAFYTNYVNAENLNWINVYNGTNASGSGAFAIRPLVNSGNFIGITTLTDTFDIDPGAGVNNVTPKGINDFLLAKFSPDGQILWHFQIGTATKYTHYTDVAINQSNGNIYVAGYINGPVDFDPTGNNSNAILNPAGNSDPFIAEYDSSGNYIKAILLSSTSSANINAIRVTNSGRVYIVGYFTGQLDMDPSAGVSNLTCVINAGSAGFIGSYDNNLGLINAYAVASGLASTESVTGLSLDYNNNVYITGTFSATTNFNFGGSFTLSATEPDVFIAKYDSTLSFIAAGKISSPQNDAAYGINAIGSYVYLWGTSIGSGLDVDPSNNTFIFNDPNVSTYGYSFIAAYNQSDLSFVGANQYASQFLRVYGVKPTSSGICAILAVQGTATLTLLPNLVSITDSNYSGVLVYLNSDCSYQRYFSYPNQTGNNKIYFTDFFESNNHYFVAGQFNGHIDADFNAGIDSIVAPDQNANQFGYLMRLDELAAPPTLQTPSITFINGTDTTVTVNFPGGDGQKRLVLVKQDSLEDFVPVASNYYTNAPTYGVGLANAGNSNYALYADTGHTVNVTGLDAAHHIYYFAVYQYNGLSQTINYLTANPTRGSYTTRQTGVQDLANSESLFTLYPNPTNNWLYVDANNGNEQYTLQVFSSTSVNAMQAVHTSSTNVDLSNLAAGVYYLHITTNNGSFTKKVIKF